MFSLAEADDLKPATPDAPALRRFGYKRFEGKYSIIQVFNFCLFSRTVIFKTFNPSHQDAIRKARSLSVFYTPLPFLRHDMKTKGVFL